MKTINKYYQELKNKAKQKTRPPPRLKLPTRGKEGPRVQTGPPPPRDPWWLGRRLTPPACRLVLPHPSPSGDSRGRGASFPGHTAQDTRRAGRKAPGTQVLTPGGEVEQSRRRPAWWRPSPFVSCTPECAHPPPDPYKLCTRYPRTCARMPLTCAHAPHTSCTHTRAGTHTRAPVLTHLCTHTCRHHVLAHVCMGARTACGPYTRPPGPLAWALHDCGHPV